MAIFNKEYLIEAEYVNKKKKDDDKKSSSMIIDIIKIIGMIILAIPIAIMMAIKLKLNDHDAKAELNKYPKAKALMVKAAKATQDLLKSETDSKYISYNSISEKDIEIKPYENKKSGKRNNIFIKIAQFDNEKFLNDNGYKDSKLDFGSWYDQNKKLIKENFGPVLDAIKRIDKLKSKIKNGDLFKITEPELSDEYEVSNIYMVLNIKNIEDVTKLKEQYMNRDSSTILEYSYRYNSHDDEDDNEMSYKAATKHLSNSEIRRAREAIQSVINKYPKIKKSANQIDLYDNSGEMDDDGKYSSPIEMYNNKKPGSYFKLIDGDLLSGYPNFKSGGSEDYSDDLEDMKKEINSKFKSLSIPAVFTVGSDGDEEDISYGIRSIKK